MSPENESGRTEPPAPSDPTDHAVRLAAAVALIERQFRGPVRLPDVARAAHLSPYHFHRLFTRRYGKTPRQMIEELRIAEVQRLLLANVSFREASRRTGFTHQSHMTERFRRQVGVTPRRWLAEARAAQARPVVDFEDVAPELGPGEAATRVLRILVVEDDPDGRDILVRLLTGAGHAVESAADGAAALDVAERRRPDLLVSDIALPGMDGCELMRTMRHRHRIPGIALTALPDDRHHARCREAGFARFLSKPVRLVDVLDAITAVGAPRDN